MLKAEKLSKTYEDGTKALINLDLQINAGEIYCLLGANGAGKTTTINLFLNFLYPSGGKAFIDGFDVVKDPLESKKMIAYVPENVVLYGNLRATHNLEFFSHLGGRRDLGQKDYYAALNKVGLEEKAFEKKIKHFSKGMRQKVALAIAILKDSPNMLLDEPTAGLDPKAAHEFTRILMDLRDEGKTILVSTHDLFRAKQIANRIGIMKQGVLVAEMEPQDLVNENIEDIYLDYIDSGEVGLSP
jgi:ABC-2 type transport system ATP-binding protein